MRAGRAALVTLFVLVCPLVFVACGSTSSPSSAPRRITRSVYPVQTLSCAVGQRVEQDVTNGTRLYQCVSPNPAQPVPHVPDVQQGDPCPEFGATTFNTQGRVFDCEPWGDPSELRWILP
jgi:hypothetical protein